MTAGVLAGSMLILVGVGAIWGLTWAAAGGRLQRNAWAGIRLAATMASDAAWTAGHRAALPLARGTAAFTLLLGPALIVEGLAHDDPRGSTLFLVLFAVGYVGVLAAAIAMAVLAKRGAAAVDPDA